MFDPMSMSSRYIRFYFFNPIQLISMDCQLLKVHIAMNCLLLNVLTCRLLLKAGAMDGPSLKMKSVAIYIQPRLQQQLLRSVAITFSHRPSIVIHPLRQLKISR